MNEEMATEYVDEINDIAQQAEDEQEEEDRQEQERINRRKAA